MSDIAYNWEKTPAKICYSKLNSLLLPRLSMLPASETISLLTYKCFVSTVVYFVENTLPPNSVRIFVILYFL